MNYLDEMFIEKMAKNEADTMRESRRKKNKKRKQKQEIANNILSSKGGSKPDSTQSFVNLKGSPHIIQSKTNPKVKARLNYLESVKDSNNWLLKKKIPSLKSDIENYPKAREFRLGNGERLSRRNAKVIVAHNDGKMGIKQSSNRYRVAPNQRDKFNQLTDLNHDVWVDPLKKQQKPTPTPSTPSTPPTPPSTPDVESTIKNTKATPTPNTKKEIVDKIHNINKGNQTWKRNLKIGAGALGAGALAYGAKKLYDSHQANKNAYESYLDELFMEKMGGSYDLYNINNYGNTDVGGNSISTSYVDSTLPPKSPNLNTNIQTPNHNLPNGNRKFRVKEGTKISDGKPIGTNYTKKIKAKPGVNTPPTVTPAANAVKSTFNWKKAGKIGAGIGIGAGLVYGAKKMYDSHQTNKNAYESYLDELFMEKTATYDQNNMPIDNPLKALSGRNVNKRMALGIDESHSEVSQDYNPISDMGKKAENLLGSFENEMEKAAIELYDSLGIPQEYLEKEESDEMFLKRQYLDLFNSPNLKW